MKNRKKIQLPKKNKKKIKYQKIMHMKKENKAEKKTQTIERIYIPSVFNEWCGVAWRGFEFRFTFSTEAAILT